MSLHKLTNNSGGQIVCDLAVTGKTLRLNNKQSETVKDSELTLHIKNLISKGLLISEEVLEEPKITSKSTVQKNSKKK